jgi:hypothetical protein
VFFSTDITVTKSRRVRWAGNIGFVGAIENPYTVLVRKAEGKKKHLEDLSIDGRTILEWILEK